jgi:hypothetical protein
MRSFSLPSVVTCFSPVPSKFATQKFPIAIERFQLASGDTVQSCCRPRAAAPLGHPDHRARGHFGLRLFKATTASRLAPDGAPAGGAP